MHFTGERLKKSLPSFTVWKRNRYSRATKKESAWEMVVAQAAPATPMPNPKIKMGSKTVFTTAPITIHAMEYFGLPSARIMLLKTLVRSRNGMPMPVIRT